MLKIFTLKYEEITVFNDSVMSNFLADNEILRWESNFFERKNEYFWTLLVEYRPMAISQTEPTRKTEKSRDESYKELLTENDWPLFNVLREWRASEAQNKKSTERKSYA
jgi:hypothetical protein